jgi:competence protein ComEA
MATYRRRFGWFLLMLAVAIAGAAMSVRTPVVLASQGSLVMQAADDHPEFPAGEGREAVMRLCVRCHSPNIILANGQDRLGWENTITKMVRLGATGDDEDFSDIADYLTAKFPPSPIQKIFINMANDKQISEVLGVNMEQAKAIVEYRDKKKGFSSLDEMKQVPGIDTKNLDAKKDRLVFGAGAPKPPAS